MRPCRFGYCIGGRGRGVSVCKMVINCSKAGGAVRGPVAGGGFWRCGGADGRIARGGMCGPVPLLP